MARSRGAGASARPGTLRTIAIVYDKGVEDLTIISNHCGRPDEGLCGPSPALCAVGSALILGSGSQRCLAAVRPRRSRSRVVVPVQRWRSRRRQVVEDVAGFGRDGEEFHRALTHWAGHHVAGRHALAPGCVLALGSDGDVRVSSPAAPPSGETVVTGRLRGVIGFGGGPRGRTWWRASTSSPSVQTAPPAGTGDGLADPTSACRRRWSRQAGSTSSRRGGVDPDTHVGRGRPGAIVRILSPEGASVWERGWFLSGGITIEAPGVAGDQVWDMMRIGCQTGFGCSATRTRIWKNRWQGFQGQIRMRTRGGGP